MLVQPYVYSVWESVVRIMWEISFVSVQPAYKNPSVRVQTSK